MPKKEKPYTFTLDFPVKKMEGIVISLGRKGETLQEKMREQLEKLYEKEVSKSDKKLIRDLMELNGEGEDKKPVQTDENP